MTDLELKTDIRISDLVLEKLTVIKAYDEALYSSGTSSLPSLLSASWILLKQALIGSYLISKVKLGRKSRRM